LVRCYSDTKLIYEGYTEGKPVSESSSDGYLFREKNNG